MKRLIIAVLVLTALFLLGCSAIPVNRYVAVEIGRFEAESDGHWMERSNLLIDGFKRISASASRTVKGPIGNDPIVGINYRAYSNINDARREPWALRVKDQNIFFYISVYGSEESLIRARADILLFTQFLDDHRIQYRVRSASVWPGP